MLIDSSIIMNDSAFPMGHRIIDTISRHGQIYMT